MHPRHNDRNRGPDSKAGPTRITPEEVRGAVRAGLQGIMMKVQVGGAGVFTPPPGYMVPDGKTIKLDEDDEEGG